MDWRSKKMFIFPTKHHLLQSWFQVIDIISMLTEYAPTAKDVWHNKRPDYGNKNIIEEYSHLPTFQLKQEQLQLISTHNNGRKYTKTC